MRCSGAACLVAHRLVLLTRSDARKRRQLFPLLKLQRFAHDIRQRLVFRWRGLYFALVGVRAAAHTSCANAARRAVGANAESVKMKWQLTVKALLFRWLAHVRGGGIGL